MKISRRSLIKSLSALAASSALTPVVVASQKDSFSSLLEKAFSALPTNNGLSFSDHDPSAGPVSLAFYLPKSISHEHIISAISSFPFYSKEHTYIYEWHEHRDSVYGQDYPQSTDPQLPSQLRISVIAPTSLESSYYGAVSIDTKNLSISVPLPKDLWNNTSPQNPIEHLQKYL